MDLEYATCATIGCGGVTIRDGDSCILCQKDEPPAPVPGTRRHRWLRAFAQPFATAPSGSCVPNTLVEFFVRACQSLSLEMRGVSPISATVWANVANTLIRDTDAEWRPSESEVDGSQFAALLLGSGIDPRPETSRAFGVTEQILSSLMADVSLPLLHEAINDHSPLACTEVSYALSVDTFIGVEASEHLQSGPADSETAQLFAPIIETIGRFLRLAE